MNQPNAGIISFHSLPAPQTQRPEVGRLVAGDPVQLLQNVFSDPSGCFHVGQWRCSPGAWRVSYTEYEFCHLLRGRVELRADDGQNWVFSAGDSFLINKGFSGTWTVLEECAKLYAIYTP